MKVQFSSRLYDRTQSLEFYEYRYEQGYMDEWPVDKKKKVFEVIQDLALPTKGEALDFGCGNGVLTEILRQALPSWKVYGTDISRNAVANARARYPGCIFFESNSTEFAHKTFDFIFTHHVLEHVFNLDQVFTQIESYLKPESSMLHVLPCGNEASYEHNICSMRKDGINKHLENRFFFEEEGHVRRLTTNDLSCFCETKGFQLQKEYYSNHYYGAIEWITNSDPRFVLMFSDTSQAVNKDAKRKLNKARQYLIFITALRLPAQIVSKLINKRHKQIKHYLLLLWALPFYVFSIPVDRYWKSKAREEWGNKKSNRNGSEMYLYFRSHKSKHENK